MGSHAASLTLMTTAASSIERVSRGTNVDSAAVLEVRTREYIIRVAIEFNTVVARYDRESLK